MDIYKFHSNPETLHGHDIAYETVPELVYKIAESGKKLTDKQEDVIAKDPRYTFLYAYNILNKPWPKGEDAIAKDSYYAYWYAFSVLEEPFLKGEDAIAKDLYFAYEYAHNILKLPEAEARKWPK